MPRDIIQPWEYLGVNVASDLANGLTYDPAVVQADAQYIVNKVGIQYVRVGTGGYTYIFDEPNQIEKFHSVAMVYQNLGAHVQYAIGGSFNHQNPHNLLPGYTDYVAETAAWCEANGIERLQLENELELPGNNFGKMTSVQVRDYVLSLPAYARAAGFTGGLTYSLAGDPWAFTSPGTLTDLGLDCYTQFNGANIFNVIQNFKTKLGPNTYVSEWGAYLDHYGRDPYQQSYETMRIFNHIKTVYPTTPNYIFAWKWVGDQYAARTLDNRNTRRFWFDVTGQRSPITKYPRDFVHIMRPQMDTFDIEKVAGKKLWLKSDTGVYTDANNTPATNGTRVYKWEDQSGNGNHAMQTGLEYKRPKFFTNIKNGKPSVFINGAEFNILECLNPSNFNIEWPTIFLVGKLDGGEMMIGKGDNTQFPTGRLRKLQLGRFPGDPTRVAFRSGNDTQTAQAPATMGDWNILMAQGERPNRATMSVNGTDTLLTTAFSLDLRSFNSAPFVLGAGYYNSGGQEISVCSILELLIFDAVLPSYLYKNIINYLSVKYAITVTSTAPATIPTRSASVSRPAIP